MKKKHRLYPDIHYQSDGNPPISAGLFSGEGERIAWWPAGISPSPENIEAVVMQLIWTRETDEPVSREAIRALIQPEEDDARLP